MDVARAPGSVSLVLLHPSTLKKREVATLTWRTGATLDFLVASLRRHSRTLILSWDSNDVPATETFDDSCLRFVSLQDRCTPIDMREVLEGTIKTVGVLYDRPSSTVAASSGTKVSPFAALVNSVRRTCQGGLGEEGFGASRHLGSEHLRPPSASAGQNQQRFMELMSWNKKRLNLTPSNGLPVLTWPEIQKHNSPTDCWVVLNGQVYDVTAYLTFHPGGQRILAAKGGKDVTAAFNRHHPWVNASMILKHNHLGCVERLVQESSSAFCASKCLSSIDYKLDSVTE